MSDLSSYLVSSVDRRPIMSASSSGFLGLTTKDIVKYGLFGQDNVQIREVPASPPSLAERVFTALAEAKIWTSRVAMHLSLSARDRYFRQLDLLHDCDEWFEADKPLLVESYKSFIRFMLIIGGESKPSLAMAPDGHLLAIWEADDNRLTIEFKAGNRAEWVVSRGRGDLAERAAGINSIKRLEEVLAPYNPEAWLK